MVSSWANASPALQDERESKDPGNLSLPVLHQGVLTILQGLKP